MKINNKDKDFYIYLGPIFGSREVQRKTGDRFYDDDGKEWYIHLESGGIDVSVSILNGKIRNVYSENEKELTEILKEIHREVASGMIPVAYLESFIKAGYTVDETKTKKTMNFVSIQGGFEDGAE